MDKDKAAQIALEYIHFIKKRDSNIKKAYLFGSFAKGTCDLPNSCRTFCQIIDHKIWGVF